MMKNYSNSATSAAAEGGEFIDDHSATSSDAKSTTTAPSFTQEQFDKLISLIQPLSVNHASGANSNQVRSIQPAGHSSTGIIFTNYSNSLICHNIALDTWIIDSGASHHICASLSCFHSYSEITPMIIKLPNGNHVTTKYAGTIVFSPIFSLT
jgi:hypothetical protein